MLEFFKTIELSTVYTELVRWVFVALGLYILLRSIRSLISAKNTEEVWAYMHIKTYYSDEEGNFIDYKELSVPITHWENVIGRAKNCDIVLDDESVSRNHGILMRDKNGYWEYRDLGSKNGTYLNGGSIGEAQISPRRKKGSGEMGRAAYLEYGDVLRLGATEISLMPISIEEKQNNISMRKSDTRLMSAGPTLASLTLFQLLTIFQLGISMGSEYLNEMFMSIGGLCIAMWIFYLMMKAVGNSAFEMEGIAFFLSTLSLAVVASSSPEKMFKQFVAILIGMALMFVMCLILRNLNLTKSLKWVALIGAVVLLVLNLAIGTFTYGAKNWITFGSFSFQPSELVKIAFIWVGAGTLDELFQKKNLYLFVGFAAFCFACLGLMGDFGTAIIFFVTFLIIAFLRSGDFSKLVLTIGAAIVGGFIILRFKPYIANRFASWGHIWDPGVMDGAGFQQTRTLSAAASGGLVGVGAGDGWLKDIAAADTDMVFGILVEEWGLIIAVLAIISIVTLSIFAYKSIFAGRSTYYTIAACGAMSMFIFQTMLNVFGCLDLLPFTGVTFPFVSNGGTSMIVSWGLLAFLKATDTRENASMAVKGGVTS